MYTLIRNARLILPDRLLEHGWLLLEDERIVALGEAAMCPQVNGTTLDAAGQWLMAGMIDLHCDGIERLVEPRPHVRIDLHLALSEADWRLAGNGITTEFHAISLDDGEFGVRSYTFARELREALHTRHDLLVRHRLHARLELSSEQGTATVSEMIRQHEVELVSLMDHSPGQGQYRDEEAFRDYVMRTANKDTTELDELIAMKRAQARNIPARIISVAHLARAAGLAIATHDDDSAAKVAQWPTLGVSISEFPTTEAAARRATELGLAVCMGAPNVLRGSSSSGNLSASAAIQAGIANILCSDYYPAAMLSAVWRLAQQQVVRLPEAARLVTLNPAQAVGLGDDYGSLAVGKIADMLLVVVNAQGIPRVQRVFIGGQEVIRAYVS